MGKGKGKGKKKAYDSDNEDDYCDLDTSASMIGDNDTLSVNDTVFSTFAESSVDSRSTFDISEALELICEKRSTQREKGLQSLITYLTTSHELTGDLTIESHKEELITQLLRMLRRPASHNEGMLSIHLLSLVGIYMGPDEEDFLSAFEMLLMKLIATNGGSGAETNKVEEMSCAALRCLAMLTFICGGEESQENILSYCEQLLHGDTTEAAIGEQEEADEIPLLVRATAADCWVLLATRIPADEVCIRVNTGGLGCSRFTGDSIFDSLLDLIQNPSCNVDSKVMVGRTFGFIWEAALQASAELEIDLEEASPEMIASSIDIAGRMLCHNPLRIDEALVAVRQLSKDNSKKVSKKNRKEQRAEFREIEEFLGRGEAPYQSIRMQGAVVDVRGFAKTRVVDAIKLVLGSGFHSALRMFPVVKDVLGVEHVTDDMDGGGEDWKVAKNSHTKKMRTKQRQQERRYRDTSCAGGIAEVDDF